MSSPESWQFQLCCRSWCVRHEHATWGAAKQYYNRAGLRSLFHGDSNQSTSYCEDVSAHDVIVLLVKFAQLRLAAWGFASVFGRLLIAHAQNTRVVARCASSHCRYHCGVNSAADSGASAAKSRHGPKQNSIVPSPERGRCDRLASGNSKSSTRAVAGE